MPSPVRRLVAAVRIRPQMEAVAAIHPAVMARPAIAPQLQLDADAGSVVDATTFTCATGVLTLTGGDVSFLGGSTFACDVGAVTLTGGDLTFTGSEPVPTTFSCATGVMTLTGGALTFTGSTTFACAGSVVTLTGGSCSFFTATGVLPTPIATLPVHMSFDSTADVAAGESPFVGNPVEGFDIDAAFPGDSKAADFTIGAGLQATARTLFLSYLTSSRTMLDPVIEVHPSIKLIGPFEWPVNTGGTGGTASWLEVRPTTHASLSAGDGFSDGVDDAYCFTFESPAAANGEAWHFALGASKVRLRGWIGKLPDSGAGLSTACWARVATSEATQPGTLANRPSQIALQKWKFDVRTSTTTDVRRCLWVNATDYLIEDFRCLGLRSSGNQAQGIYTPFGTERGVIRHYVAQAAGQAVMFGGGAVLPSDDPAWVTKDLLVYGFTHIGYPEDGSTASVVSRNVLESKCWERVCIHSGDLSKLRHVGDIYGIALKCNRENTGGNFQGGVNNRSRDLTMWFIRVHQVPTAWLFNGRESGSNNFPATGIQRADCRFILCDDLDNTSPYQLISGNSAAAINIFNDNQDLVLDHWTVANVSSRVDRCIQLLDSTGTGHACTGLTLTNAILPQATYGVAGQAVAEGNAALAQRVVGYIWGGVILYRRSGGSTATTYPSGTAYAASQAAVLPNASSGDFSVHADYDVGGASYIGTDGREPGCIPSWLFAQLP